MAKVIRVTEIMLLKGPVLTVQMDAPALRAVIKNTPGEFLELPIINMSGVPAIAMILNSPRQIFLVMDTRKMEIPDGPPQDNEQLAIPPVPTVPGDVHISLSEDKA